MATLIVDSQGNLLSRYNAAFFDEYDTEPFICAGHYVMLTEMPEYHHADGSWDNPVKRLWDLGPITEDVAIDPELLVPRLYGDPPEGEGQIELIGHSFAQDWLNAEGLELAGTDYTLNQEAVTRTFAAGNQIITTYDLLSAQPGTPYPGSMPAYCAMTLAEQTDGTLEISDLSYHAIPGETPGVYGPETLHDLTWVGDGGFAGDRVGFMLGPVITADLAAALPVRLNYYPIELVDGGLVGVPGPPYFNHIRFYFADMVLDQGKTYDFTITVEAPAAPPDATPGATTGYQLFVETMKPNDWEDSDNYTLYAGGDEVPYGLQKTLHFTVPAEAVGRDYEPAVQFEVNLNADMRVVGISYAIATPTLRFAGWVESSGETFLVDVDVSKSDGYSSLNPECKVSGAPEITSYVAPLNFGLLEAPQSERIQDPDTWHWSSQVSLVMHRVGRVASEPTPFKTTPISPPFAPLATHPTQPYVGVMTPEGMAIYVGNGVDPNYVDPDNPVLAEDVPIPLPNTHISGNLDFVRRAFQA